MVTPERAAEYHSVARSVTAWADRQLDITGLATVGSWARSVELQERYREHWVPALQRRIDGR